MHGEKNSTVEVEPIAVDLSFASDPWWTNRKEVPHGYLLEELDDIWEEQESAPNDLGFEDFESRIIDFHQEEKEKNTLDLEDSELVDNILNILLSRNLTDVTLGSADFHNKRNVMESALKVALSKYSLENRRKEDLFDRRKSNQIAELSESEIDDEIQFLEEEIERLKERKRMMRKSRNSENNRNDSSSESFDSSPPSVPLSPSPSPNSVSPSLVTISSTSTTQPCNCGNCNSQLKNSQINEISPRKRMAGMTDAEIEEESPKDKRKRRKAAKTSSSENQLSTLDSSAELITPKSRKIPSKPKKKAVGKKAVLLFKTEEVLKIKNVGNCDVEEDVDILN